MQGSPKKDPIFLGRKDSVERKKEMQRDQIGQDTAGTYSTAISIQLLIPAAP